MKNQKQQQQLIKTAEIISKELLEKIEFLIKGQDVLKTMGVDVSRIDSFREFVYIIYMAELNDGILEKVTIDNVLMFLDKGFYIEDAFDDIVKMLQYKYELKPELKLFQKDLVD
jgi:hypothetical protein